MDDFHLCPLSDYYERFLLPVSYSVAFVAGLGLNVVLLWDVCSRQPQQHRNGSGTVVYVANLAVADLLYVLTLPILIVSYAMGNVWYFGDIVCKIVRFLFIVNLHCSMTLLACVSVYRFLGVRFPVSALRLRTKRAAVWTSGSVWVVVTAEVLPTLAYSHTGLIDNQTVCFEMTEPRQFNLYFPYGIFLASSPIGAANTRNKSLRTRWCASIFFVLCFVPYHVVRTVYLFVRVYMVDDCHELNVVVIALKIWQPLISLNCCANPLLFFLGSGRYRKKLRTWLCSRNTRVLPAAVCVVVVDAGPRLSCPA
ncbi:unnamed protein product [Arctogadus glacialis]